MYVSDGGRIEVIEKPDGFMVADNGRVFRRKIVNASLRPSRAVPPPAAAAKDWTFDCASHLRTDGLANPAT